MPRRRQINADPDAPDLRSRLDAASEPVRAAAWTVQERIAWRAADLLRTIAEVVRWPFERIAWLFERRLIWPLRERAAGFPVSGQTAAGGALTMVALGVVALGVVSLANDDGTEPRRVATAAPLAAAAPSSVPTGEEPAEPVLQGAAPSFGAGVTEAPGAASAETPIASAPTAGTLDGEVAATSSKQPVPAGPAAMKVARRFAEAFVFYEIGERPERTRTVFGETTTPRLAEALEERPPRQPQAIEVPQARVLNLVPGPRYGKTYTVSASLLRVGATSELRLEMKKQNGIWRITDVRG